MAHRTENRKGPTDDHNTLFTEKTTAEISATHKAHCNKNNSTFVSTILGQQDLLEFNIKWESRRKLHNLVNCIEYPWKYISTLYIYRN